MGEHSISPVRSDSEARRFTQAILADIQALEQMIRDGLLEAGVRRAGAEIEMFLVDDTGHPAPAALQVMERIDDPRFQTEVALFNLEANLGVQTIKNDFLQHMEADLRSALEHVRNRAESLGVRPVLFGILPTLSRADVGAANLTPERRYRCLNEASLASQNGALRLTIDGLEQLDSEFESVVIEGANTSFQLHLQVDPDDAARLYNLCQLITAPLLAAAVNSPVLLGRRLWQETRIAVFQRAFDDRSGAELVRGMPTRVGFGSGWVNESILELFRESVARYRVFMTREVTEHPRQALAAGAVPRLQALSLHNGTVWRWNRPCYGIYRGRPHLRIENRTLPAGPTVRDCMANAALFYGLMLGLDATYGDIRPRLAFEEARSNFLTAARNGLDATFSWLDGQRISARDLLLEELLPAARAGLAAAGVPRTQLARHLDVVEARVASGRTGARWLLESLAASPERSRASVCAAAVRTAAERQLSDAPVHTWHTLPAHPAPLPLDQLTLADIMSRDVFTVDPGDLAGLAASVMDWRHIRHVPVEDRQGRVVGLLTPRNLLKMQAMAADLESQDLPVEAIMDTRPPTVPATLTAAEAMQRLLAEESGCLLVLEDAELIGIVTERDLLRAAAETLAGGRRR